MIEAPVHFAEADRRSCGAVGSFADAIRGAREALGSAIEAGDRSLEARLGLGVEATTVVLAVTPVAGAIGPNEMTVRCSSSPWGRSAGRSVVIAPPKPPPGPAPGPK